jgi:ubiquinone/menaquinone biosynthesis C-methylase UbiE
MITIAREKAAAADCSNADFTVATGNRLPSADGAFDAALALNVLHLLPDRGQVLAEVRRILRPGGLFISKTPCLDEMSILIRLAIPIARTLGKAPHVESFSARTLEADIAAAGFTIVEVTRHGSKRKDPRIFIAACNSA